ncbi:MAG TPA: substrate-binding domain-containing protein [Afifellaceae bacterium]|nr:substrate-binding domain-containing protein [Afifellaceae bacterium]
MLKFRILGAIAFAFFAVGSTAGAGELRIVGTGDGMEQLRALGSAFTADNPDTLVIVPPSIGSGGGIAAVGADKELLGRIARPLSEKEKDLGLTEVPIFRLPTAIYVHKSSGVTELTFEQLTKIFAGEIVNWSEVGGNDLRIKIVRREEEDSTLLVLRATMPGWKDLEITSKSKMALTTQESFDTVASVNGAIGFGPYSKFLDGDLTIVSLNGMHPTDKSYPSFNTISYIFKNDTVTPEAMSIIDYATGPKARKFLSRIGGVPVTE